MKVKKDALEKLEAFKQKEKFIEEMGPVFYPGVSRKELKPQFSALINQAADDFIATVKNAPTKQKFLNNIKTGLSRFNTLTQSIDSEDQERIAGYFEELMDCVGLESSDGILNDWVYGFDPGKIKANDN